MWSTTLLPCSADSSILAVKPGTFVLAVTAFTGSISLINCLIPERARFRYPGVEYRMCGRDTEQWGDFKGLLHKWGKIDFELFTLSAWKKLNFLQSTEFLKTCDTDAILIFAKTKPLSDDSHHFRFTEFQWCMGNNIISLSISYRHMYQQCPITLHRFSLCIIK